MAPGKFGLFKGRSRECPEPPSTENLLGSCSDIVVYSESSLPSTSQGLYEDQNSFQELALLHLDSDDEDDSERGAIARRSSISVVEKAQINYNPLPSTNATSTTTLQDTLQDQDQDQDYDFQVHLDDIQKYEVVSPDDATSVDADSLQFDQTSIFSGDIKYCGTTKKQRKLKAKKEQKLQERHNDSAMWAASSYEVLQHLLARNGTLDELIKWEAIATARGICTLRATCSCHDCSGDGAPAAVVYGDAEIATAPLLSYVSVGCAVM